MRPSSTPEQVTDRDATTRVVKAGLKVRAVVHHPRDDVSRRVEWEQAPTPCQRAQAELILSGYSVHHAS